MRVVMDKNACCAGYWHFMMLTLSTFWKKGSDEYSGMFTQTCMSVLHETQESLDVWNCKLGLDSREPGGGGGGENDHQVQTSLCIGSLISTFAIRILEKIVSRLASIKYTNLFPITVVSQCFCKTRIFGGHWWPLAWKFGGHWQI